MNSEASERTAAATPTVETIGPSDAPTEYAQPEPAERRRSFTGLKAGFRALEVRNYRLFWTGQLISLTGTWMQRTAQDWLVIQLTHSPFDIGLVTACQFLPVMLLALVGGVIVDRLPKHALLVTTQTVLLVQAAVFTVLVATGVIQIWHVFILAAVQGLANALDGPTRQAFVPELVGRKHLVNAVALNSMIFNGARIIGPATAGALIGPIGIAAALGVNAVSFIPVIGGLLLMDRRALSQVSPAANGRIMERLLEGLRYAWDTPRVRIIMIIVAFIGTFGYNFSVVLPLVAGFILKTDAQGFGSLSAFLGIGSLVGAFSTAYAKQVTLSRLLAGAAAFSLLLGAVALSTNYYLTAGLLMVLGFSGIVFLTSSNTLLQLTVPDALRGRVLSIFLLLGAGTTPIGGLLIGTLSSHFGVSWALAVCAALCIVGVVGGFLYRRRTHNSAAGPSDA